MGFLKLEAISKGFESGTKRVDVLRQFDMEMARGEFLALVGRSGSGKTTLLNLIAGLDRPDTGTIRLDGTVLTQLDDRGWTKLRCEKIGFVFQFNQLLPEFSAEENVILPGLLRGTPLDELRSKARELLERMELGSRREHRPSQLSGGEQQRVAIARALINGPSLLLADEPTGSLDLESGNRVFRLLLDLQKELSVSCLVVTHNPGLANMCDRIQRIDKVENDIQTLGAKHV